MRLIKNAVWIFSRRRSSEDGQFCRQETPAGRLQEHRLLGVSCFPMIPNQAQTPVVDIRVIDAI